MNPFQFLCRRRRCFYQVMVWVGVLSLTLSDLVSATPSTPRLNTVVPRGVQRGHEHTVELLGQRLASAEEVFFYESGIEVVELNVVNGAKVRVKIKVADDCRIGEHFVQLRTKHGVSDFRSFHIGRLPGVAEQENNNDPEHAQSVPQNISIDGAITSGDVDVYAVQVEKDQRLSIEIQAMRLGQFFDSYLALHDERGNLIADSDDSSLGRQDGIISEKNLTAGTYYVSVRDVDFGGNAASRYRLHIGNFLRPSTVFPLGGKPGEKINLELLHQRTSGWTAEAVDFTLTGQPNESLLGLPDGLMPPTPIPFRINELDNYGEQESNHSFQELDDLPSAPLAINGRIEEPQDVDFFSFTAKKGQTYVVQSFAGRAGSALDGIVHLYGPNKKQIRNNDDALGSLDSQLEFTAAADGEHYVRIADRIGRGGLEYVYRIEITRRDPKVSFGIKRVDRFSQLRQTIAVPRGGRFAVLLSWDKKAIDGTITINGQELPQGLRLQAQPIRRGISQAPVVFAADYDAAIGGQLFDWTIRCQPDDESQKAVVGHFKNKADFALGPPNRSLYHGGTVNRVAMAVVETLPFAIDFQPPKIPLVLNGTLPIPVQVSRQEGFDAAIRVEFPFRPPGVGARSFINIPKGKTSGIFTINANGKAQLGSWPICLAGSSNFQGPAWTSSNLRTLKIEEPFVTVKFQRLSVQRGEAGELVGTVEHHRDFEGLATAKILNAPPNVVIPSEQSFDKNTQQLKFTVTTNDNSPIGNHGGLFCQIHVPLNGEQVISRAGNCTVLIKPPPKQAKSLARKGMP